MKTINNIFQWDTNQFIDAPSQLEVQFATLGAEKAIVVPVEEAKVQIPNCLLQEGKDIYAYFMEAGNVVDVVRIAITQRAKPNDYYYSPEENQIIVDLSESIKATQNEITTFIEAFKADVKAGKFKGEQGIQGIPGKDGINGKDGKDGLPGKDGVDGLPGKDGKDGAQGIQGIQGEPGKDGINGTNGKDGLPGKDGVNGKDGLPGADGKDGLPGKDGVDGVSPTVSITDNEKQHNVSITDISGVHSFIVQDGKDGLPGKDGTNGKDGVDGLPGKDGVDGVNGKTPIRGTDYWTAADIQEIQGYIDTKVPTGGGSAGGTGSYHWELVNRLRYDWWGLDTPKGIKVVNTDMNGNKRNPFKGTGVFFFGFSRNIMQQNDRVFFIGAQAKSDTIPAQEVFPVYGGEFYDNSYSNNVYQKRGVLFKYPKPNEPYSTIKCFETDDYKFSRLQKQYETIDDKVFHDTWNVSTTKEGFFTYFTEKSRVKITKEQMSALQNDETTSFNFVLNYGDFAGNNESWEDIHIDIWELVEDAS